MSHPGIATLPAAGKPPTVNSICLITSGHLGTTPRVVKEADALAEAGYRVHVIYGEIDPEVIPRDKAIQQEAAWSSQAISLLTGRFQSFILRATRKLAHSLFSKGLTDLSVASRASHPLFLPLLRAACVHKADLYLGHCLPTLPIVTKAAEANHALCVFDAEDFHSGESAPDVDGVIRNKIASVVEKRLLARCTHLTSAAPLISEAYRQNYGVSPTTILNVFPLKEAPPPETAPVTPAFYWFSQTVGAGRGLEEIIAILRGLARPVRLDLRGHVSPDYRATLESLATGSQVEVRLLPPDSPATMAPHAAKYTAGLALEKRQPLNRDICLTNKAFTFLLAGIPVILSKTRAQEELATELGEAAMLIDLAKTAEASEKLAAWLDQPKQQSASRQHAIQLGRSRFNWDLEKHKLLELVSMCSPAMSSGSKN